MSTRLTFPERKPLNLFARATYSDDWFESDEPDTDPSEEGGYVDPRNPWGSERIPVPEGLVGEPFAAWRDENAPVVRFGSYTEALEFCQAFPGGIWDVNDDAEPELQADGRWRRVWLHLDGGEEEVSNMLWILED